MIELNDKRICIEGPSPYDEVRERCFRLEPGAQVAPDITIDDWVTIVYRGPYALRIERG